MAIDRYQRGPAGSMISPPPPSPAATINRHSHIPGGNPSRHTGAHLPGVWLSIPFSLSQSPLALALARDWMGWQAVGAGTQAPSGDLLVFPACDAGLAKQASGPGGRSNVGGQSAHMQYQLGRGLTVDNNKGTRASCHAVGGHRCPGHEGKRFMEIEAEALGAGPSPVLAKILA
ncbi:hypothetical protein TESG_08411 [Trichophyton tonsurans CBS 112818]|uniref:Uncharacterized protein n=1 Tax=Trichophyton tonsurans (strain CBS 112818) TaxID=647933 RepID=F2RWV7_TRIT1|nr:hypothetical protein TESG_08411 [Trichophyton tonsurans CBS 112818]